MSMKDPLLPALVVFAVLWSAALSWARVRAAKEKAGPGRPWLYDFLWLGWMSASTPRGRKYVAIAVTLLLAGPVAFLLIFALLGMNPQGPP